MGRSEKYVEQKKPDTKKHITSDSIYMKFKNRKTDLWDGSLNNV